MQTSLKIALDPAKVALAMANKGYNIKTLAEAAGRSRVIMSNWVNARELTPKQAGELAKALEVSVNDLI